jgi:hypothetical protein
MTAHLQSEPIEKGLSRRGLVPASVATSALARQTDCLQVKFFAG